MASGSAPNRRPTDEPRSNTVIYQPVDHERKDAYRSTSCSVLSSLKRSRFAETFASSYRVIDRHLLTQLNSPINSNPIQWALGTETSLWLRT